jgi:hypothetical protein
MHTALAGQIVSQGVLGNSGEQGGTLVRFGPKRDPRAAGGMGVVFDRFGSLWDRGGGGVLNRYAPDGRLLASYPISAATGSNDHLTLVGDTLVLLLRDRLFTLDIREPGGAKPRDLKLTIRMISRNASNGRLAALDDKENLVWVDPVKGEVQPHATAPVVKARYLDVAPDGTVYLFAENMLHKVAAGVVNGEGWPRRIHGQRESSPDRLQWIQDAWFGHGWHSTVKRYDASFNPAPGVVLGGGSGYVIGHVPSNEELGSGQGMALIRDRIYAISGITGVMHLMQWNPSDQKMQLVRRIGAMTDVQGLALDAQGRISLGLGYWQWTDAPDTPLRDAAGPAVMGQMAMLDSGVLATPAARYNRSHSCWLSGAFTDDRRIEQSKEFLFEGDTLTGAVAFRAGNQWRVLLMSAKGQARAVQVGTDGKLGKVFDAFALEPGVKVERWTTLAVQDSEHFLAAGDGAIHRFRWQGDKALSAGAWTPQLPGQQALGGSLCIAGDGGRLWVADTQRHRVLCFNLSDGQLLGTFGQIDSAGDDLARVSGPTVIAARGNRAVVLDEGNQRLLKLALP